MPPEDPKKINAASLPSALSLPQAVFGEPTAKPKTPRSVAPATGAQLGEALDDRTLDDRTLDDRAIDACLAGDKTAYGELVGRYQNRLQNTLLRLTGSAEEAEDVAQEAFVQAYLKLDSFQRTARFYTWLYRIAFNLAISKSRKKRPRVSLNTLQETGGVEPTSDAQPRPDQPIVANERAQILHAAIAELAEDHRQVLVLREFDGCDYSQIAELLGVPIGTIRSRLFRARSQLRERLAPLLDDE